MRKIIVVFFVLSGVISFSRGTPNYDELVQRRLVKIINEGVQKWNRFRVSAIKQYQFFYFSKINLNNRNLDYINFSYCRIGASTFINTKMRHAIMERTILSVVDLRNADFSFSNFNNARLFCDMSNTSFYKVTFKGGEISGTNYKQNVNFSGSFFSNTLIDASNFYYCNFSFTVLSRVKINAESSFKYSVFKNAKFQDTDFIYKKWHRIHGYAKTRFFACNFTNANLTGIAQLDNAAFTHSDMNGAKIERKWFNYLKTQEVKNFDKIRWQ